MVFGKKTVFDEQKRGSSNEAKNSGQDKNGVKPPPACQDTAQTAGNSGRKAQRGAVNAPRKSLPSFFNMPSKNCIPGRNDKSHGQAPDKLKDI